jgi:hypothetical protein
MAASLVPATIAVADYGIAQTPNLGGEVDVYVTSKPGGILKEVRNVGGSAYETQTYINGTFGAHAITAVVVGDFGLTNEIAGIIEVPEWAFNQEARFPVGWAGPGSIPATFGARGEILYEVEIPGYDPAEATPFWYKLIGVDSKDIGLPTRESKAIASGLKSNRWVVPGKTTIPEFSLTAKNLGQGDGLFKVGGLKNNVMLSYRKQGLLETCRVFILDWTPTVKVNSPESDGEETVTASGQYSLMAFFLAPGTPVGS